MKQVQKNSFISYVLSGEVWWCDIKLFLSYSKNHINKFMQADLWHYKLFHFHLPLWIWKVWKGREKWQKCEYLENEKSFLDEIKNIFHSFWRPIIWWKNKKMIKKADTSFNPSKFLNSWHSMCDPEIHDVLSELHSALLSKSALSVIIGLLLTDSKLFKTSVSGQSGCSKNFFTLVRQHTQSNFRAYA